MLVLRSLLCWLEFAALLQFNRTTLSKLDMIPFLHKGWDLPVISTSIFIATLFSKYISCKTFQHSWLNICLRLTCVSTVSLWNTWSFMCVDSPLQAQLMPTVNHASNSDIYKKCHSNFYKDNFVERFRYAV